MLGLIGGGTEERGQPTDPKRSKQKVRTTHPKELERAAVIRILRRALPGLMRLCAGSESARERPYKAEVGGSKPPAPTLGTSCSERFPRREQPSGSRCRATRATNVPHQSRELCRRAALRAPRQAPGTGAVRVERRGDRRTAEPLCDGLRVRSGPDREGCGCVPEVVEPKRSQTHVSHGPQEHAVAKICASDGSSSGIGEYQAVGRRGK
jgi:hypothetical protein